MAFFPVFEGAVAAFEGESAEGLLVLLFDVVVGAEAEICEFDVSLLGDEDIVGFYVSMDEAVLVNVVDGEDQLGDVKLGVALGQDLFLHEQGHEVSPRHVLHDQVKVELVLEGEVELGDPLAGNLVHGLFFFFQVFELVFVF